MIHAGELRGYRIARFLEGDMRQVEEHRLRRNGCGDMATPTTHRRITNTVWHETLPPLQRFVMLAFLKYVHGENGVDLVCGCPALRYTA
jgi:hypothetical protein